MIITRRTLLLGAAATALAACDTQRFEQELGIEVDEGQFGNPTAHNRAVMTGQIDYVVALTQRFAREVPTTVYFEFDSTRLDAEAQAALMRQAAWIRQFPEVRFSVYGHTDLVGSERYNHALGRRRAQASVDFLVRQGIGRNRVRAVVSRGQREPVIATQQPERQNRRAVTQVSGFLRRHPTVMNGEYAQIIYREFVESATYVRPRGF
jgi:outer membrane protein OmpA-like peptidoglycan-associated protein